MHLFVATEEEVRNWVRMLSILIEMKNENLDLKTVNPF
jgi:hypothetical protein